MLTVVPATRKIALDKLPRNQRQKEMKLIILVLNYQWKCQSTNQQGPEKSPGSRLNVTWLRLENSRSNTYSSDSTSLSIFFSCPDTEDFTGLREKQVETAFNLGSWSLRGRCWNDLLVDHRQVTFWWDKLMLLLFDWITGNGSRREEEIDIWNPILTTVRTAGRNK